MGDPCNEVKPCGGILVVALAIFNVIGVAFFQPLLGLGEGFKLLPLGQALVVGNPFSFHNV
jgi:hypothetical protein